MEKNQRFVISGTNDKLWNFQELVSYLSKNQHGNISLLINPEAICLDTLGVYQLLDNFEFKQVDIYTSNQLEKHAKYNIIINSNNPWFSCTSTIPAELHTWTGKKTFLTFYHRPTASRLGLASYLYKHYPGQSHVHFPYETDLDRLQLFEFEKLGLYCRESLLNAVNMSTCMPLKVIKDINLHAITTKWDYDYSDNTIIMYKDIFVDLVGENHVMGCTFYPTEKTARPMWLKKPFIVFGSRDYLDYLHQMGFKTFCNFWSEEYDGYEGRDRYIKILKLIDELSKKSKQELEAMYLDMQSVLDHNYNMLLNKTYTTKITLIT